MSMRWANSTLHVRWHIAALCLGIVAGVWVAQYEAARFFIGVSWFLTAVMGIAITLLRRHVWMLLVIIAAGILLGIARGSMVIEASAAYERLIGSVIQIEGVIVDDADTNAKGDLALRLGSIVYESEELGGRVWVTIDGMDGLRRGDTVTVSGMLAKGFGTFDATMYDARLVAVVRSSDANPLLEVRDALSRQIRSVLPETEAALGTGFLLGQKSSLPDDFADALTIAGLVHIVVASGYNLTILVRLTRRLFENVSKYLSTLLSTGLILGFIGITGVSPSMSRAGLVALLSLAAWYYGRTIHPVVLLLVAMGATVLINPSYVWGDIGWLLSFGAFFGVLIFAPLLQAYYFGNKKPGIVRQILGEAFAAWVCTLPILLVAFGVMSNVAIIANILIVPFIPVAMLLLAVTAVISWIAPPLVFVTQVPLHILMEYMVQIAYWAGGLEWAQSDVVISWWQAVAAYTALIVFSWYMWRVTGYSLRSSSIVE